MRLLTQLHSRTEMGQLMTSSRAPEDNAWNYLRPLPAVAKFLHMEPQAPGVYECVVLDGLPSKVVSNSSNPPNSFHTSDLFSPHPTIPNAWKYLGRSDDRVTLVNGEKVLPVPFEHQVRQNELVREAVVFGIDKAIPGILIIPSEKASELSENDLFENIWPSIAAANDRVEGFSQVSREMVKILPFGAEYPCTDKGTLIRAASYKKFAEVIETVYKTFEQGPVGDDATKLALSITELESYLLQVFATRFGLTTLSESTDFFDAGVDSLQAITLWGLLKRELDLGSATLGQNVVFEYPNIRSLATHLYTQRTGIEARQEDELQVMIELIEKYSSFKKHVPGPDHVDGQVVVSHRIICDTKIIANKLRFQLLTGTTGSLGAHILAQLMSNVKVKAIYCLVRASSQAAARERIDTALASKKLGPSPNIGKVICLPSDLSNSQLGLEASVLDDLKKSLTTVIHCAWAVNFNLGVRSFEQQHIKGVSNLINLCLSVHTALPARFYFCSSISAAAGTPLPAVIAEAHVSDLSHAQDMGYARSKLVTERIVKAAAEETGMVAQVLRVGQIIGDSEVGIWNTTEAIPLMIQSAVTMGALPALNEVCYIFFSSPSTRKIMLTMSIRHRHGYLSILLHMPFLNSQG
jgi:thioester reductase-like protein